MKYPHETEAEFLKRQKDAERQGICVFRDDANREMILDIIDDYMDIVDAIIADNEKQKEILYESLRSGSNGKKNRMS